MMLNLLSHKTNFIRTIFIYGLVVSTIMLLGNACQDNPHPSRIPTPTLWFDPNEDISFGSQPRGVQMFHLPLDPDLGDKPILLSWYTRPYRGSFEFVLISEDNTVRIFAESPNLARSGGLHPVQLTPEEHQKVIEYLQPLSSNMEIPTISNEAVVLIISFEVVEGERQKITCTESTCPVDVKDVFKIVQTAFKRESEYGLAPLMPFTDE